MRDVIANTSFYFLVLSRFSVQISVQLCWPNYRSWSIGSIGGDLDLHFSMSNINITYISVRSTLRYSD